ncbi:hypothetical protein A4A49_29584 [Nicotiana attenuata]|uniref:Uncharacterized protein n=1 Tax=Nicotiana attenuata TaxID=49451 RepID=A0A314L8E1_NICAT|nr:hypothetical protein A4A49_29584 [Nicotiana attenuata]
MGYENYNGEYQQQSNQNPLYTSNFSPHHSSQPIDFQSSHYLDHSPEVFHGWTAGVVPDRGYAMGSQSVEFPFVKRTPTIIDNSTCNCAISAISKSFPEQTRMVEADHGLGHPAKNLESTSSYVVESQNYQTISFPASGVATNPDVFHKVCISETLNFGITSVCNKDNSPTQMELVSAESSPFVVHSKMVFGTHVQQVFDEMPITDQLENGAMDFVGKTFDTDSNFEKSILNNIGEQEEMVVEADLSILEAKGMGIDATTESETEKCEPIGEAKGCTTKELGPVLETPTVGEASSVSSSTKCFFESTMLPSDEYQVMNKGVVVLSNAELTGFCKNTPSLLKPSDQFTFTSLQGNAEKFDEPWRECDACRGGKYLEKATKEDQYSHELKIPISSIKDEVENHLEYLLSRLLIGKCTVEKACEIAMQKVVNHFRSELLKWLDEILFLDLISHEQLRQLGCYEFYHINSGIVIANEQYFEIFSELRMNHKKLEAVVLDSFSIKSSYGKNSEEANIVFFLYLRQLGSFQIQL